MGQAPSWPMMGARAVLGVRRAAARCQSQLSGAATLTRLRYAPYNGARTNSGFCMIHWFAAGSSQQRHNSAAELLAALLTECSSFANVCQTAFLPAAVTGTCPFPQVHSAQRCSSCSPNPAVKPVPKSILRHRGHLLAPTSARPPPSPSPTTVLRVHV